MPKHPMYARKSDRMITPGATAAEIEADMAAAPLDRVALDYERVWGVDRLPSLVSPETARRYGAALAALNEALSAPDPVMAAALAANCIKGLHAMDAEARRLGRQPIPPDLWEFELDGVMVGLVRETADWPVIAAMRPNLTVYTLREAANALVAYRQTVADVAAGKGAPPAVKPPFETDPSLNDSVPF